MESVKKMSINSLSASIIRNSLWFLIFFGVVVAVVIPFTKIEGTLNFQTATIYSFAIAGISTFIRSNSYAKYFLEYQRYQSYIGQMLLFYKHKSEIYLEDVQKWIDAENEKLKDRFLKDASFQLGVKQEEDGTIDLYKFYPQEPKKPKRNASAETLSQYQLDLEKYEDEKAKFRVTLVQKRIIKRLENKDYPRIPWKPSAILNVIGDADFYVNRNIFNTEKVYKRANMIMSIVWTAFILFVAGGITASLVLRNWAVVLQTITALFSIISALVFGGIQGSNGGRKEERSLVTANGIFKQIKPQTVTNEEVKQYIRENQIVVLTNDGNEVEHMTVDQIAAKVIDKIEVIEEMEEKING